MKWSEQPSDIEPAQVKELFRTLSLPTALAFATRMRESAVICFAPECRAGILDHLRSRKTELGGLLLGRAYVGGADLPRNWGPVVLIEAFLPSEAFRSSSVSLAMATEIWDRAREVMTRERQMVVGWYHSHPNLGAFFSGTDRATQRAFFNRMYNVGLVVDPIRREEAWFIGPDAACGRIESVLDIDLTTVPYDHISSSKGTGSSSSADHDFGQRGQTLVSDGREGPGDAREARFSRPERE